ncbi:E3 ubiquitin-protein ligase TRIM11-like [Hyperolius riggenbachi]|uniref:E3 ubiquitin-protein ligase TRIM11-like n=1 Tax=Hyperolius riggenbachi TaxID=752182 RepID=UPI0035A3822D
MASADLRKELECPVCLTIYTDPVILRCGHNFCQKCIDRVLDSQEEYDNYFCPECREEFMERPTLQRNIIVRKIAEHFLSTQPDQEEAKVSCTQCIHTHVPAVMSCLLCEVFLCDNHLRVHSKAPEHVLCDPNTSLENRKCSVHKKILEYYCTEDAACICVSCRLDGEHRGHQVEMLDEAFEKKKKKLSNVLQKLMAETEETSKRIQSMEENRRKAQEKANVETEIITALFRALRRWVEDLEKQVLSDFSTQAGLMILWFDDVIQQLEIKKDKLLIKMYYIEELCNITDPLTVLQESDTGDLCDTEDRERHDKQLHDGGDLDLVRISHTLHTGLSDIMSGIQYKKRQTEGTYIGVAQQTSGLPVYADILLDVNTAANDLHISADGKTAVMSEENQNHPETPERFQEYPQVLSSQRFSSGRHYWEVDVGGSEHWRAGMCYPSIDREGWQSGNGNSKRSWCLERLGKPYTVRHNSREIWLCDDDEVPSDRIRIYLDYEAGEISFYALCNPIIRHLHTFTASFTEPLHAVITVWDGCVKISGGTKRM